jgi:predicted RNase H-like HicB family nuclease
MKMNKYGFKLFWSDEDEGYIATCPEFPTLSAFGETPELALAEAHIALNLFIEEFNAMNKSLPKPHAPIEFSGQFRVRLPKSLHRQLAEKAESEDVSLNSLLISYLSKAVTGETDDTWLTQIQAISTGFIPEKEFIARRPHFTPNHKTTGQKGLTTNKDSSHKLSLVA